MAEGGGGEERSVIEKRGRGRETREPESDRQRKTGWNRTGEEGKKEWCGGERGGETEEREGGEK